MAGDVAGVDGVAMRTRFQCGRNGGVNRSRSVAEQRNYV